MLMDFSCTNSSRVVTTCTLRRSFHIGVLQMLIIAYLLVWDSNFVLVELSLDSLQVKYHVTFVITMYTIL